MQKYSRKESRYDSYETNKQQRSDCPPCFSRSFSKPGWKTHSKCVCVCCMITVNSRWLLLNFTDRASRLKETHNLFILSRSEQKQAASQLPWHSLQPESNAGWTRLSCARSYKNKVFPPLNIWQLHSDLIIFHIYSCLYECAVVCCSERPHKSWKTLRFV